MYKRSIAVLIPCYNEELTIKQVIKDFQKELPDADIYVYDNNSNDNTAKIAHENGAIVKREYRQGKGNVLRSMFQDIEADIYVLVDGDDTYPAKSVHDLIKPILDSNADMVVGDRLSNDVYKKQNKRMLHNFGNNLVKNLINKIFKSNLHDIMTGYRVFNKKFIKNMPINSSGFEIETEMTLHALDKRFLIKEIPVDYKDRPEGSVSKLNTYTDGIKVLKTIMWLFKDYKPLVFFTILSSVFFVFSLASGIPVLIEYFETMYVHKIPSAILAVGLMLISILSLFSGFILDTIVKHHREDYELNLIKWISKERRRDTR